MTGVLIYPNPLACLHDETTHCDSCFAEAILPGTLQVLIATWRTFRAVSSPDGAPGWPMRRRLGRVRDQTGSLGFGLQRLDAEQQTDEGGDG